ncbi:MAG: universal stress protein [Bacteroidota bacterium]
MPAPVIVASDLSDHAAEALQYALRFRPEPVTLYHVHDVSHPEPYGISAGEAFQAMNVGTTSRHVDAALAEAVGGLDGVDPVWESAIRPVEAICRFAERTGAALVVIGTHGRTGFRRAVIGSVAEAVVRDAPCPVLAVPLDETDPWSGRPTRRVLAAVDLFAGAEPVADEAARVADLVGAEPPMLLHVEDGSAPALAREVASGPSRPETAERAAAALTGRHGDVRTAKGHAGPTIVERAAALNADLVVVGTGQRHGAARALGSVAAKVLRTARRPVLVVPTPPDTES